MTNKNKEQYQKDFKLIGDYLNKMNLVGEWNLSGQVIKDINEKELLAIGISIKNDGVGSLMSFRYSKDEKRIEDIKVNLQGVLADKSYDFLKGLELIALELGCNELRTWPDSPFWINTDWMKFPDGTYRKYLRPDLN